MQIDWTPVSSGAISVLAAVLEAVAIWAISRAARWFGVSANNLALTTFEDGLVRSIQAGAHEFQELIAARGWAHRDVKSAVVGFAVNMMIARFAPALRHIGLDPDNEAATRAYVADELNRVFPTAIAPVANSPVTPPLPPSPPGTTAADLNRRELARHEGGA